MFFDINNTGFAETSGHSYQSDNAVTLQALTNSLSSEWGLYLVTPISTGRSNMCYALRL